MRKITQEELNEILRKHELWLTGNSEGERADLRGADLRGADLIGANLRCANLRGADLIGADLENAFLRDANLIGANLRCAILYGADLRGADLENAFLRDANLIGANLRDAILTGAILSYANLIGANLRDAILTGAILSYANLRGADLIGADLENAFLRDADLSYANLSCAINLSMPMACPTHGAFIGWKKCYSDGKAYMVKLQIPASAKRLSGTGRKCRTNKAKVLEIQTLDGEKIDLEYVCSKHCPDFQYRVGETVRPTEPFCEDRWKECSSGIHFFIDREEAARY